MNVIEEFAKELKEEKLLDMTDYIPFDQKQNNSMPKFIQTENSETFSLEPSQQTRNMDEHLHNQTKIRHSISNFSNSEPTKYPNSRVRITNKIPRFSRTCKCCDSNVFILDAFCTSCNERMIGNFLYYAFFVVSALVIGFMIFYMAISNPY